MNQFSRERLLSYGLALLLGCGFAVTANRADAWGGHDVVARAIVERLPDELLEKIDQPETLRKAIVQWSGYPDSFDGFEPEAELIGPGGLALLERHNVKRRYDLHHDWARPVIWLALVDALRGERYKTALFWIAVLSHSTSDMSACNHDPIVHVATYDWSQIDLMLPGGQPFGRVAGRLHLKTATETDDDKRLFAATVDSMLLADDGRDARRTLFNIMLYGHRGAGFCAERGYPLLKAAFDDAQTGNEEHRLARNRYLAELGAWGVVSTLRDTEAALRLAKTEFAVDMPELQADYRTAVAEWVAGRPLADEALFKPVLRPVDAETRDAVGVVLEPTWRMNEASLGFHQRVLAVAACRTLADIQHAYATLDVRQLQHTVPDCRRTPVILMIADRLRSYAGIDGKRIEANLAAYRASGGHLVWIGEHIPQAVFPELGAPSTAKLPEQWPNEPAEVAKCELSLAGTASPAWPLLRSPQTPAGWQRPACPTLRRADPLRGMEPLVEFTAGGERGTVGVVCRNGDAGGGTKLATAAVLPTVAIHPYLFDKPDAEGPLADIRFDAAGRTVLMETLQRIEKE